MEIYFTFFIGIAVGALVAWLALRGRSQAVVTRLELAEQRAADADALRSEAESLRIEKAELLAARQSDAEKLQWMEQAREVLGDTFTALASNALQSNAKDYLERSGEQLKALLDRAKGDWTVQREEMKGVVDPLGKNLEKLQSEIREMEQKREGAYKSLDTRIGELMETSRHLQATTTTLQQAMKSSQERGKWGELQLRRIVEMAGLSDHIDFDEQVTAGDARPDMVVHLPNNGILPVDAKAPMAAYFNALDAESVAERTQHYKRFASELRSTVQKLSRKEYWSRFERAPDFVAMFIPNESALSAAYAYDKELFTYAMEQRVLPVTPVLLLALLKTVAYGWQQQQMADNARRIADAGKELHERLGVFLKHYRDVGAKLDSAVGAYNASVGSIESRLMPAAKRLSEYGVGKDELPDAEPVDRQSRLPRE